MAQQDTSGGASGLSVISVGLAVNRDLHPDRTLPFWVLGVVEQGHAALALDDHAAVIGTGGYYLLPPQVRHRGTHGSPFSVAWWHFTSRATGLLSALPWCGQIPEDLNAVAVIRTCQRMQARRDDPSWITLQVEALLARLASHHCRRPQGRGHALADDVLDWLLQHRQQAWDRTVLERRFNRSYRSLNREFARRFGTGIRTRHLELRIGLAQDLLAGGHSLGEVAEAAGFQDYFTFLRRFRSMTGVTAGTWRRHGGAPTGG